MTDLVFIAVIGAALLHASWNALVKGGRDKTVNMGAVVLGHMPLALCAGLFAPLPAPASYPYLLGGMFLHMGYQVFLLESYKFGDLVRVYPLARGSAPLLVTLFSVVVLGVVLSVLQMLAVLVIAAGILLLAFSGKGQDADNQKTVILALTTGLFIASYSLVDGLGAQQAGTPLGFYAWLSFGNGVLMILYLASKEPGALGRIATNGKLVFVLGGSASFVAYALVTWAFTQAPIALVTALRETSIAFAAIIGVLVLKERINAVKALSIVFILAGAILLKFVNP